MERMPAGIFKARCLRVMENVRRYRSPVVITKKGRPVAKLVPADAPPADVFGCMVGMGRIAGDVEAPVGPATAWEALRRGTGGRAGAARPARAASRRPRGAAGAR